MPARRLFLAIYLLSGLAALIYEVAWTRLLTLEMGHTVAAASTVLAAFMGGLAAGAALGGRFASVRPRTHTLRAYAVLELVVAALALLLPSALWSLRPVLSWAHADGSGGQWFSLVRVATSLALVTVPACAMGATFPLAVRWLSARVEDAERDAGDLYAANTIGAVAGATAAGFLLLPWLGLRLTTLVAAGLNLIAAGGAWWLSRGPLPEPTSRTQKAQEGQPSRRKDQRRGRRAAAGAPARSSPIGRPWLAACVLGLTGFVALVSEVAWTRILALVLGPTTYAFSLMLAAFIGGIAAGAAAAARLAPRLASPIAWLGLMPVIAGSAAVVASSLVNRLPLLVAGAVADPQADFTSVLLLQAGLATAWLLPMTMAFGAAFPLAVRVAARRLDSVAADVARIYTANTIGAIAGALAGGFLLIPGFGLETTIKTAALLAIVGGTIVAVAGTARRVPKLAMAAVGLVAAGVVMFVPAWNRLLITSGAYKYARLLATTDLESALEAGELLYYGEGPAGTVTVRRVAGDLSLAIDGKVDASNAGDMLTQKLLAHLPLLLHPNPRDVCIIGLGSGVTLGAALRHPIARADALEISPQVVQASRYFRAENRDALSDRRTRLLVADGRSHLLLGTRRYDVIVSEPSNPWMAGIASLFTREFFAAARDRLAPGGILCQWAHTYDISADDLRSIAATLASVFPHVTMWLVGEGDVLMLASVEPFEPRLPLVARHWNRAGIAEDLADVRLENVSSLLSLFVADTAATRRYASGARLQTDDDADLEFSGPRSLYARAAGDNAQALRQLLSEDALPNVVRQVRQGADARALRQRGEMLLRAEAYRFAFEDFIRAVRLDPRDQAALDGLIRSAAAVGRHADVVGVLSDLAARGPAIVSVRLALSRLLASSGEFDAAAAVAAEARAVVPAEPTALEQLATVYADAGNTDRLETAVAELERLSPGAESTLYAAASLRYLRGQMAEAIRLAEQVTAGNPKHAKAQNLLGGAYASLGDLGRARRAFEAAMAADPRDPAVYTNLGLFETEVANPRAAIQRFAEALTIDPASPVARAGLADALASVGESRRASAIRARRPGSP